MAGKFSLKKFADIDLDDAFFDSLKADYPGSSNSTGFIEWFKKKSDSSATALVFEDEFGVGAFVALKNDEEEEIPLQNGILLSKKRMKISTFRIAERYRRQRIGEGAIGLVLWKWQKSNTSEIYVTVFEKWNTLISQFEKFGFQKCGLNGNNELVLIKSKDHIDFSDPYKAFPFIKGGFDNAGYVIIDDNYHDTMFAYSELANKVTLQNVVSGSVSNGLSKIYVGRSPVVNHEIGQPVFIYRRYTQGNGQPRYKSCITSYCLVADAFQAKSGGRFLMTFDELKSRISNKSVFDENELYRQYRSNWNVTIVELLYYGYFGAGNNVNMDWLDTHGFWMQPQYKYPTEIRLTERQFETILMEGRINVPDVIIN